MTTHGRDNQHRPAAAARTRALRGGRFVGLLATIIVLSASGCGRSYRLHWPDGREVEVRIFGADTKIGHLSIETPEGKLVLDNADVQDQQIRVLGQAVTALEGLAGKAVAP